MRRHVDDGRVLKPRRFLPQRLHHPSDLLRAFDLPVRKQPASVESTPRPAPRRSSSRRPPLARRPPEEVRVVLPGMRHPPVEQHLLRLAQVEALGLHLPEVHPRQPDAEPGRLELSAFSKGKPARASTSASPVQSTWTLARTAPFPTCSPRSPRQPTPPRGRVAEPRVHQHADARFPQHVVEHELVVLGLHHKAARPSSR